MICCDVCCVVLCVVLCSAVLCSAALTSHMVGPDCSLPTHSPLLSSPHQAAHCQARRPRPANTTITSTIKHQHQHHQHQNQNQQLQYHQHQHWQHHVNEIIPGDFPPPPLPDNDLACCHRGERDDLGDYVLSRAGGWPSSLTLSHSALPRVRYLNTTCSSGAQEQLEHFNKPVPVPPPQT